MNEILNRHLFQYADVHQTSMRCSSRGVECFLLYTEMQQVVPLPAPVVPNDFYLQCPPQKCALREDYCSDRDSCFLCKEWCNLGMSK